MAAVSMIETWLIEEWRWPIWRTTLRWTTQAWKRFVSLAKNLRLRKSMLRNCEQVWSFCVKMVHNTFTWTPTPRLVPNGRAQPIRMPRCLILRNRRSPFSRFGVAEARGILLVLPPEVAYHEKFRKKLQKRALQTKASRFIKNVKDSQNRRPKKGQKLRQMMPKPKRCPKCSVFGKRQQSLIKIKLTQMTSPSSTRESIMARIAKSTSSLRNRQSRNWAKELQKPSKSN